MSSTNNELTERKNIRQSLSLPQSKYSLTKLGRKGTVNLIFISIQPCNIIVLLVL